MYKRGITALSQIIYPNIRFGSHNANPGQIHTQAITIPSMMTKGTTPNNTWAIGTSGAIFFTMYRLSPTGGVTRPISRLTVIMTANHIGSKPNPSITGINKGATIKITAAGGMKHHNSKSKILIRMITLHLPKGRFKINSLRAWVAYRSEDT